MSANDVIKVIIIYREYHGRYPGGVPHYSCRYTTTAIYIMIFLNPQTTLSLIIHEERVEQWGNTQGKYLVISIIIINEVNSWQQHTAHWSSLWYVSSCTKSKLVCLT